MIRKSVVAFVAAVGAVGLVQKAQAMIVGLYVSTPAPSEQIAYRASIYPLTFPGSEFQTATIQSNDGQYVSATEGQSAWDLGPGAAYASVSALIGSLNQGYAITLDAGLATERHFAMTLDAANLATFDLTPPVISFPAQDAIINTLTPTFTFTTPTTFGDIRGQFLHSTPKGGQIVDLNFSLTAGSTQWAPPVVLLPGAGYILDLYVDAGTPLVGFTTPVDDNNVAMENWQTGTAFHLETIHQFTTAAPEPGSCLILAGGIGLVVARGGRNRKGLRR